MLEQKKRIFQSVNPNSVPYKIEVIPVNNNNKRMDLCESLDYSQKQNTVKSNDMNLENSMNRSEERSIIF